MTWYLCVVGCVALYMALGVATATLAILVRGEPEEDDIEVLILVVVIWPIVLAIDLPIFLARKIRAWRDAKPEPFEDDLP